MRPVLFGDVTQVARFLMTHPPSLRAMAFDTLRQRAKLGDKLRKHGCFEPYLGDGTLSGTIARQKLPCEPDLQDPDFRHSLMTVLTGLSNFNKGCDNLTLSVKNLYLGV